MYNKELNNTIMVIEKGEAILRVKASDDGKVLVNEKEITTTEEVIYVLNTIIKAISSPYNH